MKKHLALISLITGVGIAGVSNSALAIPYQGATVYRAGNEAIIFSSTPGSRLQVNLGSINRANARLADACGFVRISSSTGDFTGLKVDGVPINASNLPINTNPSCTGGVPSEPRTENYKTANNQVVVVGKTPNTAVTIELPAPQTQNVTINACGFGVLRSRAGESLPTAFSVGSSNYTTASLPNSINPPYQRTVDGAPLCYVTVGWQ